MRHRKLTLVLALILVVLIGGRLALPWVIRDQLNKRLAAVPTYDAHVERVGLSIWRGAFALKDFRLRQKDGELDVAIESIENRILWKPILRGRLVAKVLIDQPVLQLVTKSPAQSAAEAAEKAKEAKENVEPGTGKNVPQVIGDFIPFRIDRLELRDGTLYLREKVQNAEKHERSPEEAPLLSDLNIVVSNLTNSTKLAESLVAKAQANASVVDSGRLKLDLQIDPSAEQPHFDLAMEIERFPLPALNRLLEWQTGLHFNEGTFALYGEASAANGAFKGYIKPLIENLDVETVGKKSVIQKAKKVVIKVAEVVLKNSETDQIAARVPFEGRFEDPNAGVLKAVLSLLKNAFIEAIKPGLEGGKIMTEGVSLSSLIKRTAKRWSDDDVPRMSAALSYYTTFSLAPLLMLAIAAAGFAFGREAAEGQIIGQISGLVGAESAHAIQSMIKAADRPAAGTMATVIGVLTLFFGASGVFNELRRGLNDIWDTPDTEGLTNVIRKRVRLFGMVLGIIFLLMVSLVVSAAISATGKLLAGALPVSEAIYHLIDFAISFFMITLLFAAIYKFLPRTSVAWRDTWLGAAVTSFLFVVGKLILGLYLGKESAASSYGAAGSVLIILLWVYYSGIIFYTGAEFTRVFADHHGSRRHLLKDSHETQALPGKTAVRR